MTNQISNPLALYWLIGMEELFPDIQIDPRDLAEFKIQRSRDRYLLRWPLLALANSAAPPWEDGLESLFLGARERVLAICAILTSDPMSLPNRQGFEADPTVSTDAYGIKVDSGADSVMVEFRPLARVVDALAALLIAVVSTGVLVSLRNGELTIDDAEDLILLPATAALLGRLPLAPVLVKGFHNLMSELVCANARGVTQEYVESQVESFLTDVTLFLKSFATSFDLDPRWALTTRVAKSLTHM